MLFLFRRRKTWLDGLYPCGLRGQGGKRPTSRRSVRLVSLAASARGSWRRHSFGSTKNATWSGSPLWSYHQSRKSRPLPASIAGGIAAHIDLAAQALAQIDDDDTPLRCGAQLIQQPLILWCIANPVGKQDQGLDRLLQQVADDLERDPRIQGDDADGLGLDRMQGPAVDPGFSLIVRRPVEYGYRLPATAENPGIEGMEAIGVHLGAAVATKQLVIEEQGHFMDRIIGRQKTAR